TYTLQFNAIQGDGIRIFGRPGGGADFISVGELEVFEAAGPPASNPAPTLNTINPTAASAGGPAFTLTVNGTSFVSSSVIRWNGAVRTTTFVSATQLSASIPAADIAAEGNASVTVFTPTPGGGTSSAQTFTINAPANNPVPTLSSISPASATAGGSAFTLTVTGSNFVSSSVIRWNGAARTTSFVSAAQLTASIPAVDIAAEGSAQVTVFTPTPGGGTASAQTFTINAPPAGGADLTQLGTIIARVTAPTGGGSRNREVIRDGDKPPVGNFDSSRQYDTYDGNNTATEDWIGYQYSATQNFGRVVFQEGRHFGDGGWFETLTVQVRQGGVWNAVSGLTITPAYPAVDDNETFETYTLQFNAIQGDGIRIFGRPGGGADFISVGELEVFEAAGP
ncbi:MAG: IPT/TIG domain-containing protein, partial [Burkholderiales bacterium]|nr:IPT/TIG domain-containing protein [Burkholderiales bacterium]